MVDLTWQLFCETGSIDTYLLFKELEKDSGRDRTDMKTSRQPEGENAAPAGN